MYCERFSEKDVVRGFSASQGVVVHRRKIVVNQGCGVYHFERKRHRHNSLWVDGEHFRGGETKHRTQALSSGEKGIRHGIPKSRRDFRRTMRAEFPEVFVD
ncbi:hypothetical protein SDC9_149649 [bioreactor metagenome]|uniref:Uncharacterized protein n=1 Tax=bioreactor metagenome TaxID=1076179 RepID=A0A645EPG5_9ZZZZ